jgi:membrane-associated protease RseP (regulator of RpoE activity)
MRLWPLRARPREGGIAPDDLFVVDDLLRRSVDDVFAVRDRTVRGGAIVYRGTLRVEPREAVERLIERFKPFGFTPFLRAEGGDVVLQALPLGEVTERRRVALNLVLFALTCVSTLIAGYFFSGSPTFDALRSSSLTALFAGVPFAFTLLAILGVHEFGHYFTARHYRASVSLPYFIPAPPPIFLFGTMGAIIRMRSPARDRNSLFDIAAAGPLAGMAVAVPALVLGLVWSTVTPAPPGGHLVFGDSLLMRLFVFLTVGRVPDGMMLYTHPVADAAWVGFFVTALNLFPVGQLDGGRIAYALFGRHHRTVGVGAIVATLLMGVLTLSANWFVWTALIFFLVGLHHAPPIDDMTPLSPARQAVGIACLLLLVLLIPPVPIGID